MIYPNIHLGGTLYENLPTRDEMDDGKIPIRLTRKQWARIMKWYETFECESYTQRQDDIVAEMITDTINYDRLVEYEKEEE